MGSLFSSPISSSAASMLFPSPECSYTEDDDNFVKIPYENCVMSCSTTVKYIPAFFFWNENAKTTIIYSHGNGEDVGHSRYWLYLLHKSLKVNVIGYDYEGYGLHEGSSSENSCYRDIQNVVYYLKTNFNIDSHDIILYGRSLGTGPTVDIATKHRFKGVILEAPYKSIFSVVDEKLATSSACLNPFRNESKIDRIMCPIIIFHGTNDNVIDYKHSVQLQKKSMCNLITLHGGGHNNLQTDFQENILTNIKEHFLGL